MAASWVCQPDTLGSMLYDGQGAKAEVSSIRDGMVKTIDLRAGTVTYKSGGDVNPDELIIEKIVHAQIQSGKYLNTYESKIEIAASLRNINISVYYIDFENGNYSESVGGTPASIVFYGKCAPTG